MVIPTTFDGPIASTASASDKAESMPPDDPITAVVNPHRRA
jgi:hypothetical protein